MSDRITIERETLQAALNALEAVDALIEHQFTGKRTAMTALQYVCDDAAVCVPDLRAALAAQPADNEWRTAIEDELICAHIGTADSFPDASSALKNLIDWHVAVSLDPAVSSEARALIDRGKATQPTSAVPLTDERIENAIYRTIPASLALDSDERIFLHHFARVIERAALAAQPASFQARARRNPSHL